MKQKAAALVLDLPRFLWATRRSTGHARSPRPWVLARNRHDRLVHLAGFRGVDCEGQKTSDLSVARLFPWAGRRLMVRALDDWPIALSGGKSSPAAEPLVSFVMGHRGRERLPGLLLTLQSLAAQRHVACECVLVEQSSSPRIRDELPEWVRYFHQSVSDEAAPYCRASALNFGSGHAACNLLVFHDGDMLVPRDYAREIVRAREQGYEIINLKRFIFYLTRDHSRGVAGPETLVTGPPRRIVQNAKAGGSLAVLKEAFEAVGGFDESFVGWGGEDNEFWERAVTRKVLSCGYLPMVHLWHEQQPERNEAGRRTARLLAELSAIDPEERIAALRRKRSPGTG